MRSAVKIYWDRSLRRGGSVSDSCSRNNIFVTKSIQLLVNVVFSVVSTIIKRRHHSPEREEAVAPHLIIHKRLQTHFNVRAPHGKSLRTRLTYPLAFVKRGELIPLLMLLDDSSP